MFKILYLCIEKLLFLKNSEFEFFILFLIAEKLYSIVHKQPLLNYY